MPNELHRRYGQRNPITHTPDFHIRGTAPLHELVKIMGVHRAKNSAHHGEHHGHPRCAVTPVHQPACTKRRHESCTAKCVSATPVASYSHAHNLMGTSRNASGGARAAHSSRELPNDDGRLPESWTSCVATFPALARIHISISLPFAIFCTWCIDIASTCRHSNVEGDRFTGLICACMDMPVDMELSCSYVQDPDDAVCSPQVGFPMPLVHEAGVWDSHPLQAHPPSCVLPFTNYILDEGLHGTRVRINLCTRSPPNGQGEHWPVLYAGICCCRASCQCAGLQPLPPHVTTQEGPGPCQRRRTWNRSGGNVT